MRWRFVPIVLLLSAILGAACAVVQIGGGLVAAGMLHWLLTGRFRWYGSW
jgi:predicted Abi (CAAX) family protease